MKRSIYRTLLGTVLLTMGTATALGQLSGGFADSIRTPANTRNTIRFDTLVVEVTAKLDTTQKTASALSATLDAGQTAGALDISASGGAVYSVPFVLPPGLGGAAPQLGLMYNSQGGNSIVGYGWSIAGLSAITRVAAVEYIDGFVGGINFDHHDRFALDGQRLLLKSGTYGGDGAEYETENYSNLKITSHGVSPYGAGYGPAYFEVRYPDGTTAWYGYSIEARNRMTYAISASNGPLGERINYHYFDDDDMVYIRAVTYGALQTATPINQVSFEYVTPTRREQSYIGGESFVQTKLLSKVTVLAHDVPQRHYALSYDQVSFLGYQRVSSVQELNGPETRALDPIEFNYNATSTTISHAPLTAGGLSSIASNNATIMTADFTGSGGTDFLLYTPIKEFYYRFYDIDAGGSPTWGFKVEMGKFADLFSMKALSAGSRLFAGDGLGVIRHPATNQYKFQCYIYVPSSAVPAFQYEREWTPPLNTYYSVCEGQDLEGIPRIFKFVSGDFNGDGLTDIMAISRPQYTVIYEYPDPENPTECEADYGYTTSMAYFINMDRRITSGYVGLGSTISANYDPSDRIFTADFNGDGKTDILIVKDGSMRVYSLNQSDMLQLLWTTVDGRITRNVEKPVLLGDYNGDGKMDVMFSTGYNSVFATFMSTGKGFVKHEKTEPFQHIQNYEDHTYVYQYFLIPNDIDGDGKTDIIFSRARTHKGNASAGQIQITAHYNTNVNTSSQPLFTNTITTSPTLHLAYNPIPIFVDPDRLNPLLRFGFVTDDRIQLFQFTKDMRRERQLGSTYQNGISHQLQYNALLNGQEYVDGLSVYGSTYEQVFPFADIHNTRQMQVVSKFTRTFSGQSVQRIFTYSHGVYNADGMGFLGFKERLATDWHVNASDPNRTFSISIQDPQLRGATVRSFVSKNHSIASAIKNTVLPDPPPAGGIADGATLSDYIVRNDVTYSTTLLPNKTFINVPKATASKDMLSGTFDTQTLLYDAYYNPTNITENINGEATRVTVSTYDNSVGWPYYRGRLLSREITMTEGIESFSTKENFTYTDYLPTYVEWRGNGTSYITQTRVYDLFGNITSQTTSVPGGGSRTETMQYDVSGRFMTQLTDPDGLTANYTYDSQTGNVLTHTDPYGRTESYGYDTWGRRTSVTNYLSNTGTTSYTRSGNNTIIHQSIPGGGYHRSTINAVGQTIEVRENTLFVAYLGQQWQYDVYGRRIAESAPSTTGSYTQWNTQSYDIYGRINQTNSYTGRTVNMTYSGLTTTQNDGIKTISTTANALGRTVSMTDPGGTVTYTYFPNGNLKSTNFGGSVQTIEQDGWGRKTKLTDPSAGVYTYAYDGWDQITQETTPKGTTIYTYDAAGKMSTQSIVGDDIDMQWAYTYDATTKLPTQTVLVNDDGNNTTYTYSYDGYKRLSATSEDNPYATFTKTFTYNSQGHIGTETHQATDKQSSTTAQAGTMRTYDGGILTDVDMLSYGGTVWKALGVDARGMLSGIGQSGMIWTYLDYDAYGYPQQTKVDRQDSSPANLMTLGYTFNTARGFPTARSNSMFGWSETFAYDNLDRLTVFNDNNGTHSQQYDLRGRITSNSRLGDYNYTGTSYQQDDLDLNTVADAYYQTREQQLITFNAFKSPTEIHEPGHDRYSFQYNGALQRANVFHGSEDADELLRPYRKHYSTDGGVEITKDLVAGTTEFIFYLGGDAYSAPAIWKKTHSPIQVDSGLYFLHRDYLGSIVLITDAYGYAMEKRQFDAWGNIVKLTDGSNNNLTNFVVLDRGYTGHEHLLAVGLIHMNARLYDPLLGRFVAPDNFVQSEFGTQAFNRYGYAMNNPMVYVDENGEFIIATLVGIGVGILSNGILNTFKDKPFFDNWVMAGVMGGIGGFIAGYTAGLTSIDWYSGSGEFIQSGMVRLATSSGQQALSAAIGVGSSYLPGREISLGDNFSLYISPAILFGTSGWGLGANVGLNYRSENFSASLSYTGFYGRNAVTGYRGYQSSLGGSARYKNIAYSGTNFFGSQGNYSHGITVSGKNWSLGVENDFLFSDKYRTTALHASLYGVSAGVNLWTGNPGGADGHRPNDGINYIGSADVNPDQFRAGFLFLSYNNHRMGIDSEKFVRAPIQNGWHAVMRWMGSASYNFRVLNVPTRFYGSYNRLYPHSYY